jgi:hypothetical protein
MRRARVQGRSLTREQIERFLPDNYHVVEEHTDPGENPWVAFLIEGEDVAGWTLDGYVIPRLASGLIFAEEIK